MQALSIRGSDIGAGIPPVTSDEKISGGGNDDIPRYILGIM